LRRNRRNERLIKKTCRVKLAKTRMMMTKTKKRTRRRRRRKEEERRRRCRGFIIGALFSFTVCPSTFQVQRGARGKTQGEKKKRRKKKEEEESIVEKAILSKINNSDNLKTDIKRAARKNLFFEKLPKIIFCCSILELKKFFCHREKRELSPRTLRNRICPKFLLAF